jgi:hypothetical protein
MLWLAFMVAVIIIGISLIPFVLIALWYLLPWALIIGGVLAIVFGRTLGPPEGKILVEGGTFAIIFGVSIAYGQYST